MPLGLALLAAVVVTAAIGALVYLVAVRPFLRRGFSVAWVGGVVAAAIALRGLVRVFFTRSSYTFAEWLPVRSFGNDGVIGLGGGATLQVRTVFVGAAALALAGATGWVLERSRFGAAVRAASEDRLAASLCGVAVEELRVSAFGLAGLLAGGIAVIALSGSSLSPETTTLLGLKGLVAAVAVRFGRPRKLFAAAVVLGLVETALGAFDVGGLELGPEFGEVVPIAVAILLLAMWGERRPLQERA